MQISSIFWDKLVNCPHNGLEFHFHIRIHSVRFLVKKYQNQRILKVLIYTIYNGRPSIRRDIVRVSSFSLLAFHPRELFQTTLS